MANQDSTGLTRIIKAFFYSMQGLYSAFKYEAAFRQELALCVFLIPFAIWLGESGLERAVLIGSLFLILITELLNTGIEAVVDRVSSEQHELSGRAKDTGSAAVFLSLINALIIWILILLN